MKPKKIPTRQCVGCSEKKTKQELVRIVRTTDAQILLDKTGKVSGRGTYICPKPECLEKAQKTDRIAKALRTKIPPEIYDQIAKELDSEKK